MKRLESGAKPGAGDGRLFAPGSRADNLAEKLCGFAQPGDRGQLDMIGAESRKPTMKSGCNAPGKRVSGYLFHSSRHPLPQHPQRKRQTHHAKHGRQVTTPAT